MTRGDRSDQVPVKDEASVSEHAPTVERDELKNAILTSVRWVAGARGVAQLITFGSSLVLARLISPAEFGRAAVALIVIALAGALIPQAFGSPLVRFTSIDRSHLESAAFLSIASGILLTLATLPFAALVLEPVFGLKIAELIMIASPAWLLAAVGTVPFALLQRKLDFGRISMIEVWALITGVTTSLALAAVGANAEAVVAGGLAGVASASIISLVSAGWTVPRLHGPAAREIVQFGLPVAASSLAFTGSLNVDYAVLAARLGPTQVGLYWRAYQVAVEYQGKLSGILLKLGLPIYSRSRDLEDMKAMRARISRLHATVLFGPLLTLIPLAPLLIPLLFGEPWRGAIVPTQILVVAGMCNAVLTGTGPLLIAAGKAMALLRLNVANLVTYGVMVYFVAPHGLTAVCVAVSTYFVGFTVISYLLMQRLVDIPARRLLSDTIPGLVSGAALLAVAFPLTWALSDAGVARILIIAAVIGAGGIAYGFVLRVAFPSTWADVALLVKLAFPSIRVKRGAGALSQAP